MLGRVHTEVHTGCTQGVQVATPKPYRDGWRAQIQRDGQRISKTFRLKREAERWLLEQQTKKEPLHSQSLQKAIDRYLETVSIHKRVGVEWERRRFKVLTDAWGNPPLSDITTDMIAKLRDARMKEVSGSTIVREFQMYRHLFKVAQLEWRWIHEHPMAGLRLPKESPPRTALWGWREILRILRAGRRSGGKIGEVARAFHIALRTGMRQQEVIDAVAGFDPVRGVVVLPSTKTNARGDTVPLTAKGRRLLVGLPAFTITANECSVMFSKLCRQNLVKGLTFHDARATALTHLARRMDVMTLARISRHKDLSLLMNVYYRETADQIAARI